MYVAEGKEGLKVTRGRPPQIPGVEARLGKWGAGDGKASLGLLRCAVKAGRKVSWLCGFSARKLGGAGGAIPEMETWGEFRFGGV